MKLYISMGQSGPMVLGFIRFLLKKIGTIVTVPATKTKSKDQMLCHLMLNTVFVVVV